MNAPLHRPWIDSVALLYESDECLLWPFGTRGGRRPQDAYPALGGAGYAHVLVCTLVHGPAPAPGMEVEHLCGVKLCVNKRHVTWTYHLDNCARRTEHGTQTIGERHPGAKLTERDVAYIRATPRKWGSGVKLAAQFGVSTATISLVRSGVNWRHCI